MEYGDSNGAIVFSQQSFKNSPGPGPSYKRDNLIIDVDFSLSDEPMKLRKHQGDFKVMTEQSDALVIQDYEDADMDVAQERPNSVANKNGIRKVRLPRIEEEASHKEEEDENGCCADGPEVVIHTDPNEIDEESSPLMEIGAAPVMSEIEKFGLELRSELLEYIQTMHVDSEVADTFKKSHCTVYRKTINNSDQFILERTDYGITPD